MINADEIVAAAMAETGLADLEAPAILEGLGVYVRSLNDSRATVEPSTLLLGESSACRR